ncbi:MAG: hypothetical protein Q9191_002722 [Dirinaria sp. TL-2023a]
MDRLSPEIVSMILKECADLDTLHSAIHASATFYRVYQLFRPDIFSRVTAAHVRSHRLDSFGLKCPPMDLSAGAQIRRLPMLENKSSSVRNYLRMVDCLKLLHFSDLVLHKEGARLKKKRRVNAPFEGCSHL